MPVAKYAATGSGLLFFMINVNTYHPQATDTILVLALSGKLNNDAADVFFTRVNEEIDRGHKRLIFDCADLEHISSLGFGTMIRTYSRLQQEGGTVRFAGLHGMIEDAFRTIGFHKLFENYPSVEAAAESIAVA